ncbi:hypothetical protein N0V88_000428 [Collariella sp. IMI 366227]|nr:hypothetical protein N0V88_000428 [Collariella sp. IMI 366227]
MAEKAPIPAVPMALPERPYHAKRPHRKSRTGCRNCKSRKVCGTCTARHETCVYLANTKRLHPLSSSSSPPTPPLPSPTPLSMRLLWFYTTATYASFSTGGLRQRSVDTILKVTVVQHAFAHPFLMDCLLGLSAMHINHLGLSRAFSVPRTLELTYRTQALTRYRQAVERADPETPDVDLDASARCVPGYLLFMVASVGVKDGDYGLVQTYYKALQYLGSLYLELENGFSQMLLLRIATFLTFLPSEFIDAAREKRPRALVILAHSLAFVRFRIWTCWWMDGISEHEIPSIREFLGEEWADLMRVPMAAVEMTNDRDIARLLLNDPTWDKPTKITDNAPVTSECERELTLRAALEVAEDEASEVEAYVRKNIQIEAEERNVPIQMCPR